MIIQALVSMYGLMSLSVVGLLMYTLVMTNVQEQRRELAILRILGSQRKLLFGIVVTEVLVIGLVGVGVGVLVGQVTTSYGVVPLIEHLMRRDGLMVTLKPAVSLRAILPALVSATLVLLVSAVKPAQDASRTRVIHAINPGAADNVQLEDLEQLRERGTSLRLFFVGLAILLATLIFNLQVFGEMFGNPTLQAASFLVSWIMLGAGLAAAFYIIARPLEKLILYVTGLVVPRVTYFAKRNVARSTERNTLISLLVLLSGVLPSFLATQSAMDYADIERDVRLNLGAPVSVRIWSRYGETEFETLGYLRPSFLRDEIGAIPGIDQAIGVTYEYPARVHDAVDMRSGRMTLLGVSGDLSDVLYDDLTVWVAGGPDSLAQLQEDTHAVVISQGMAEGLAVPLGGTIVALGEGLDHEEELTVVGIAQRLPGFEDIGRRRSRALEGGSVLISLEGFRQLSTDPKDPWPGADDPVFQHILATKPAEVDPQQLTTALHEAIGEKHSGWPRVAELVIHRARANRAGQRIILLVLTLLSFITAVFGVFAVIYVTIYSRRREIGMMKAFGARNSELNGMLSVESVAMTLSAALAGILAGTVMAFVLRFIDSTIGERPVRLAIDNTVLPAIVGLVSAAAVVGTIFSAWRIIRRKAVEILRMS
jgi:putative ABC transport system permease protein